MIALLVGFAIEWSQFTFDLSRATHYIRIMDSRNFFPIFELLCLSFWLIMFFFCLGPCLVWCGWARTDDHKGLRRRWTIETSNIHKSEKVVEETVTLCNQSNLETQAYRRVSAAIWCLTCNQIAQIKDCTMNRFCVIFIIIICGINSKGISISSIAIDSFNHVKEASKCPSPTLHRK